MLQRTEQVNGEIDSKDLLEKAIKSQSLVGLQALLKSGLKDIASLLGKDLLKHAIENKAQVDIIKILLDPRVNPQAASLVDAEVLNLALQKVIVHEASEDIISALLDTKVTFNKDTLKDDQIRSMFEGFTTKEGKQKILAELLDWLVEKRIKLISRN